MLIAWVEMSQQKIYRLEELDLREVLIIYLKNWKKITISLMAAIIVGLFYSLMAKPVYYGEVSFEIGEVITSENSTSKSIRTLEVGTDLREVLAKSIDLDGNGTYLNFKIEQPRESQKILMIKMESSDRNIIKKKLTEVSDFILKRHSEKYDFYTKNGIVVSKTKKIGNSIVLENAIRPNLIKILVGVTILGLVVGMLWVFIANLVLPYSKE